MIPAGQLNKRIEIQRRVSTQDNMGQETESWTVLASRKASIKMTTGGETVSSTGEIATNMFDIKIRYDQDTKTATTADRVVNTSNDDVYDIVSVDNVLGLNTDITLKCLYRSRGVTHS
jgi:SPP1 family predicted phage head-tail adaptor